jgi:hypothetical protein
MSTVGRETMPLVPGDDRMKAARESANLQLARYDAQHPPTGAERLEHVVTRLSQWANLPPRRPDLRLIQGEREEE